MSLVKRARCLRRNMTPEEVKLWYELKQFNRRGFHFRRQVPLDGYILDFAEFHHRLIIEVDGSQHSDPSQKMYDRRRDTHFRDAGFCTFRFWNNDINTALDGVVMAIEEALTRIPLRRVPRHLPREGGG